MSAFNLLSFWKPFTDAHFGVREMLEIVTKSAVCINCVHSETVLCGSICYQCVNLSKSQSASWTQIHLKTSPLLLLLLHRFPLVFLDQSLALVVVGLSGRPHIIPTFHGAGSQLNSDCSANIYSNTSHHLFITSIFFLSSPRQAQCKLSYAHCTLFQCTLYTGFSPSFVFSFSATAVIKFSYLRRWFTVFHSANFCHSALLSLTPSFTWHLNASSTSSSNSVNVKSSSTTVQLDCKLSWLLAGFAL